MITVIIYRLNGCVTLVIVPLTMVTISPVHNAGKLKKNSFFPKSYQISWHHSHLKLVHGQNFKNKNICPWRILFFRFRFRMKTHQLKSTRKNLSTIYFNLQSELQHTTGIRRSVWVGTNISIIGTVITCTTDPNKFLKGEKCKFLCNDKKENQLLYMLDSSHSQLYPIVNQRYRIYFPSWLISDLPRQNNTKRTCLHYQDEPRIYYW